MNRYRLLPEPDRLDRARQILLAHIEETAASDIREWVDQRRRAHQLGAPAALPDENGGPHIPVAPDADTG